MSGRVLWAIALLSALFTASCKTGDSIYSDELERLDDVLSKKHIYEQYLLDRVGVLKSVMSEQKDPLQTYNISKRVAQEFMAYSMDSTMFYLDYCRKLALEADDPYRIAEINILIAEEYTISGYHLEARELLNRINGESLPKSLHIPYLKAEHNLAGEVHAYASDSRMVLQQDSLRTLYRNLLLEKTEPGTFDWIKLKREEALQYGRQKDIMEYSRKLVEAAEEGSHNYAIACFHYQEALADRGCNDDRMLWLIRSAVTDAMCATKDYASLNTLSYALFESGDIDRAFKYSADHCMPDAIFFGGKLRPWQIAQFFPEIGRAYQDKNLKWQRKVNIMFTVMAVLIFLLVLLIGLVYLRQQVLDKTRMALSASYLEIEKQNMNLVEANRKLSELNSTIMESDKVKQEYIALFLSILSENINTTRQYKNHVLKYLRRGMVKDIESEIESLPLIEEDILEFYKMFDRTFLNLYPDFVEKINSLLADGESIVPKSGDILTPELRVFALVKLGISDSSKIASLLHYSVNTIYNYRAKIKNKAKGDRAGFEDAVRMI